MGTKKSVMLSDHSIAIMEKMTKEGHKMAWSSLVNRSLVTNEWLFKESLPDLDESEWQIILNAYAGTIGSIEHPPFRVASDLMDDMGLINVDEHPNAELVKRIHAMSQCEQFAILSFVERFWSNDWNHVKDFDEIIETIKG